jgi:hypothetical protein
MAPLDGKAPPADEFWHWQMIAAKRRAGQPPLSLREINAGGKNHDGRACARPSRSLRCYPLQGTTIKSTI